MLGARARGWGLRERKKMGVCLYGNEKVLNMTVVMVAVLVNVTNAIKSCTLGAPGCLSQ